MALPPREGYEIWEYGRQEEGGVQRCDGNRRRSAAIDGQGGDGQGGSSSTCTLPPSGGRPSGKTCPPVRDRANESGPGGEIEARLREELMAFIRWGAVRPWPATAPRFLPFVCADVRLLDGDENAAPHSGPCREPGAPEASSCTVRPRGSSWRRTAVGRPTRSAGSWAFPSSGIPDRIRDGNGFAEPRAFGNRPEGISRTSDSARAHGGRDVAASAGGCRRLRQRVLRLLRDHRMDP